MAERNELLQKIDQSQRERAWADRAPMTQEEFKRDVMILVELGEQEPNIRLNHYSVPLLNDAINRLRAIQPDQELADALRVYGDKMARDYQSAQEQLHGVWMEDDITLDGAENREKEDIGNGLIYLRQRVDGLVKIFTPIETSE
jgi:hypothetical protein